MENSVPANSAVPRGATRRAREATERILVTVYPRLWRFAAAACGSSADPDDVVQEALLRTLRVHTLADLEYPVAYLRKAVMSVIMNDGRRSRPTSLRGDENIPDSRPVEYPSDLSDLLLLDPKDRALLYLVDVEGLSFEEATEILGFNVSAARQRASRARRALRDALTAEDHHEH